MRLLKYIRAIELYARPCEAVPRGYGFSYYAFNSDGAFYAPIPLNFLIGWGVKLYWWLVRGPSSKNRLREQFIRGRDEGYEAGYRQGYEAGVRHTIINLKGVIND
jgi:hypothetical protein